MVNKYFYLGDYAYQVVEDEDKVIVRKYFNLEDDESIIWQHHSKEGFTIYQEQKL